MNVHQTPQTTRMYLGLMMIMMMIKMATTNDVESGTAPQPPPPSFPNGVTAPPVPPDASELPPTYEEAVHSQPGDAPPSYASLFGEIQDARRESGGFVDFLKKLLVLLAGTIGCTILLGLLMAVPMAMIVLGAINIHDCPIQRMIPIYLLVFGCFGILKNIISLYERYKNHRENETENNAKQNPLEVMINCFLLAWFIAGNYWIYSVHRAVNMDDPTHEYYCDPTAYLFAFWVTTTAYIFVGLLIICVCCTAFCTSVTT
ncbi:transmembrane protein 272-like [Branchiostoma floridae]|uniref:Transmembrane protein 272-like n=2 Tax=Branchiostoma floridae TaxID=7739 RepID=A0A9J7N367_BRAFL|nr:transmembrane protein 272-like [Branchiostoma floridae]